MAFVENELVKQALTDKGEAALPIDPDQRPGLFNGPLS